MYDELRDKIISQLVENQGSINKALEANLTCIKALKETMMLLDKRISALETGLSALLDTLAKKGEIGVSKHHNN